MIAGEEPCVLSAPKGKPRRGCATAGFPAPGPTGDRNYWGRQGNAPAPPVFQDARYATPGSVGWVVQDSSRGFRGRALETRSPAGFLRPAAPKRSASNWNWKRRKGRLARSVLTSSARTSTPSTGWVAPYLEYRVRVSQSRRGQAKSKT